MASDDYTSVEVKGLKELNDALAQLPERIGKNVLRGAVSSAAAEVRKEAKAKAPIYTGPVSQGHPPPGALRRAVYQKQIPERSGPLQQTFFVGVRHGKKYQSVGKKGANLDAYYFPFVEFGTSRMAARPFMRPAFEGKKNAAVQALQAYMAQRIPLEADKLNKGPKT